MMILFVCAANCVHAFVTIQHSKIHVRFQSLVNNCAFCRWIDEMVFRNNIDTTHYHVQSF